MKILLVGANGTLGQSVRAALRERGHDVLSASRKDSDIAVDITDPRSIQAMYERAGRVDAVACAAGSVPWRQLSELSHQDMLDGMVGKALSQVELVRQGSPLVSESASFTLITGVLARDPIFTGTVASLANGAVESFVRAAAIELPHRQRINAVSPTVFTESLAEYGDAFIGFEPEPVRKSAQAYVRSIEGHQTGRIFEI
ncbi:short chain dehydrogenase [Actinomadura darangshiensis]|uniref:Short chain dehydrogenase n=1 Tax=Actinomadura darangshiensis TaxID=705336 RepID=A0A4R5B3J1_9ACTN|nr:short chain dehydrogenase [Actinomadura darangshiensis]